jgi:hypothetical protein
MGYGLVNARYGSLKSRTACRPPKPRRFDADVRSSSGLGAGSLLGPHPNGVTAPNSRPRFIHSHQLEEAERVAQRAAVTLSLK